MTAEQIFGDLILLPRPSARHGRLALRIAQALAGKDHDAPDGWVILPEAELHLGWPDPQSLVLVPDFSGWRVDAVPDSDDAIAVEVVPAWVCETSTLTRIGHPVLTKTGHRRQHYGRRAVQGQAGRRNRCADDIEACPQPVDNPIKICETSIPILATPSTAPTTRIGYLSSSRPWGVHQ